MNIEQLGGIVTKAVSPEPRKGAPAPRVAEFDGGMINAVGLANPGLEAVIRDDIPWLAQNVEKHRVLVNVIVKTVGDFVAVCSGFAAVESVHELEVDVAYRKIRDGGR